MGAMLGFGVAGSTGWHQHTCDAAFYLRNRQHRVAAHVRLARIDGPFDKLTLDASGLPHGSSADVPGLTSTAGTAAWFANGQLHRGADRPAIVMADGSLEFWVHNQLHRDDDRPALAYANGLQAWFVHGVPQRRLAAEPHVVQPDGTCEWLGTTAMSRFHLHRLDAPARVYASGVCEWHAYGKLHRLGGPAIQRPDGAEVWAVNGCLHRVDGEAAVKLADGTQAWFVNDVLHRVDGPAFVFPDGSEAWFIDGSPARGHNHDDCFAQAESFQYLREVAYAANGTWLLEEWQRRTGSTDGAYS